MAKKRNYQKYSNIEVYLAVGAQGDLNFCNVKDSTTAQEIDELIDLAFSKGLKHPYIRFMKFKGTWLECIFYTNSKSKEPKHIDGRQTLGSLRNYLQTL